MKKTTKYNLVSLIALATLLLIAFGPVPIKALNANNGTGGVYNSNLYCNTFSLSSVVNYNASTYDATVAWTGTKAYMGSITVHIYNTGNNVQIYSGGASLPGSATVYGFAYGTNYGAHLTATDLNGDPWDEYCTGTVSVAGSPPSPDFSLSCPSGVTAITAGSSTSFNLSTTPSNGFSSAVSFANTMSPSGTQPGLSYSNNNQIPAATTIANITTTAATTPATYTITFTGTGGSKTHNCTTTLTVNAAPPSPSYGFSISPVSVDVLAPSTYQFTIQATCSGGATGPIYNLAASSAFSNLTYNFSSTTVNCGSSVTLTIGNTGAIDASQYSTPQARLGQSLNITGSGN